MIRVNCCSSAFWGGEYRFRYTTRGVAQMRVIRLISVLVLILTIFGCYPEITGTVLDAETGAPIEGAIVFVQWTKTKGLPGLTYRDIYKIVEVETDKDGKFTISGTLSPFVDPPRAVIYKRAYVTWRNDFIFPGWKKRTDFKYQDDIVIKLEKFREEFSHKEHLDFIGHGISYYMSDPKNPQNRKLENAIQWEEYLPKKAPDSIK